MLKMATRRTGVPVSVKIRIADNLADTVELARRAERMGAAWVTVHGRTPRERCQPVNYAAIALVKDAVGVPVIANGDICSAADAARVAAATRADGVMVARGLLAHPAMFNPAASVSTAVREWVDIALSTGTPFPCFHHHLMFMLDATLSNTGACRRGCV